MRHEPGDCHIDLRQAAQILWLPSTVPVMVVSKHPQGDSEQARVPPQGSGSAALVLICHDAGVRTLLLGLEAWANPDTLALEYEEKQFNSSRGAFASIVEIRTRYNTLRI